jgi:hypothetical protein
VPNGATLASSQITGLPAGTYYFEAMQTFYSVNTFQIKLRNVTDAADILFGFSNRSISGSITVPVMLSGRFTLAGTKTIELDYHSSGSGGVLGQSCGLGTEVYGDLKIWKVA